MRTNARPVFHLTLRLLCGIGIVFCALVWIEYRVAAQAQQAQAAKAPFRLPFQGRLLKPNGNPVEPGNADVLFSIYDTAVGSSAVWSSGLVRVAVKQGGLFNAGLEAGTPALNTLDFTEALYVGVRVDDPSNAVILENEPEMLPRIPLVPALYSHRAGDAQLLAKHGWRAILEDSDDPVSGRLRGEVPVGSVVAWYGDPREIPARWRICDGAEIFDAESLLHGRRTPDLRSRFIQGENDLTRDLAHGAEPFRSEFTEHIEATIEPNGDHDHIVSDAGEHSHDTPLYDNRSNGGIAAAYDSPFGNGGNAGAQRFASFNAIGAGFSGKWLLTSKNGVHSHAVSKSGTHTHIATISAEESVPSHVRLHFIMRIR